MAIVRVPIFIFMKRLILILLIGAPILALGSWWWGSAPASSYQTATVFADQERPLPAFSLLRHDGEPLTREDLKGRWSLLFFGYSHCPDVCTPTLLQLTTTLTELADERSQILFVSTDPERDTPQALQKFVGYFDAQMWGVTGQPQAVADFARAVGAFYQSRRLVAGYLVDHSTGVWLIDPQLNLAAVFTAPLQPQLMADDLRHLIEHDG